MKKKGKNISIKVGRIREQNLEQLFSKKNGKNWG